jgi:BlaI family penicillinase repressor
MSKRTKLTVVEWEIMESIWKLGKQTTARDVVNHAFPNGEKAYTTVQTILNTLHNKGMLKREKIGMVNFYTPAKSRQRMIKDELSLFVSRAFHGSVPALANFLIDSNNLGQEEIQAIKELLDKKAKELGSKSP